MVVQAAGNKERISNFFEDQLNALFAGSGLRVAKRGVIPIEI